MATATEPIETVGLEDIPYPITSDVFEHMIEHGLIPVEKRVYLWDGRLYEKMAKTPPHAAVHGAFTMALVPRLPTGLFVGPENPVRLDNTHLPLPDLIVARGGPLDFFSTRYPDGRDVVLVVEVAATSLREDLGVRLSRYALTLPMATYLVADIPHHQILIFNGPRATEQGTGE
ncbi:MAG: Uma2 family endonuclease, partial [Planctomycetia bacterium]|nr:Uma2 family endonuclease [Planctomycetia bacterium]